MKLVKMLGILVLLTAAVASPKLTAADDVTGPELKKQDRELHIKLKIAKFEGQTKAATGLAEAKKVKLERMADLLARKAISQTEYRKHLETSQLAYLAVNQHAAELEGAKAELAIFQNEASGKEDPQLAKNAYGKMWKAKERLLATEVDMAKIRLDHQTWYTENMGKLAASHAVNPKVYEEALMELSSARETLAGKEAELKVMMGGKP